MNGVYSIYKRDRDGLQGDMIENFTGLEISLSWAERTKIHIDGVSPTGETTLSAGDSILIYRNGYFLVGGIITEVETSCQDPASGIKYWTADGEDDSMLLDRRQVLADPVSLTFDGETYDRFEGYAYNRLIHYINNACYRGTTRDRWLADQMTLPSERPVGTESVSAYRSTGLDKVIEEIGKEDELFPVLTRDPRTGATTVTIPEPRDMTDEIVISPEYGNVTEWSRKDILPDFNAIWVVSGDYSRGRLYVYAEDIESIRTYGRIETIVTKSDAKVWEGEEETTGTTSGEEEETEEEHLTEEDVLAILEAEARTQLKEHGVKRTWSVSVAEQQGLAFMEDWMIGDKVTCVIDGEKFETQITQAKISYSKGIETVSPTVGEAEKGLFGRLFETISGLDDRITRKENE